MGTPCSTIEKEDPDHVAAAQETKSPAPAPSKLVKRPPPPQQRPTATDGRCSNSASDNARVPFDMVAGLDATVCANLQRTRLEPTVLDRRQPVAFSDVDDYFAQRREILAREGALAFDYACACAARATDPERRADAIIQALKKSDKAKYDQAEPRVGYGGQRHKRFPGDHYLSNLDVIETTELLNVARHMPKGAHLHIHFNACLQPHVLLDVAKKMSCMFITSDLPLVPDNDYANFVQCEIQFSILPPDKRKPGNLFDPGYRDRQTMGFSEFREQFQRHYTRATVDEWLVSKLMFNEEETYGFLQTAHG